MSKKIELGTVQWSMEFKGGELVYGSPRIDILQDNYKEVGAQVPDGKYKWTLTLDLDSAQAEKPEGK